MALITIFTPTYNRLQLLPRLYESLKNQTCKCFEWLVIDDGSTDETGEYIKQLEVTEKEFKVRYVYKHNGGLQTGYTEAFKNIDTILCACVDSDDSLRRDAIELIMQKWESIPDKESIAGILALDCDPSGKPLGGLYPDNVSTDNLIRIELGKSVHPKADRMLITRTELCKQTTPATLYPNERSLNATYLYLQISENNDYVVLNDAIYVADYQLDGMTNNIFSLYLASPNSWADYRAYLISLKGAPLVYRAKKAVMYCSSCFMAQRNPFKTIKGHFLLILLAYPFGRILNIHIKNSLKR